MERDRIEILSIAKTAMSIDLSRVVRKEILGWTDRSVVL